MTFYQVCIEKRSRSVTAEILQHILKKLKIWEAQQYYVQIEISEIADYILIYNGIFQTKVKVRFWNLSTDVAIRLWTTCILLYKSMNWR